MGTNGGDDQTKVEEWMINIISNYDSPLSQFSSTTSIFKVPEKLRLVKKDAYDPQLVSIGPIHYEDPRLRSMEDHKQHYLISLLKQRQLDVGKSLKECFYTILKLDRRVRACYADPIELDNIKLATILLQDAGFMLELFWRCYRTDDCNDILSRKPDSFWRVQDDPVFTTSWMKLALKRDFALLENQIPFFVLDSLYKFVFPGGADGVSSLNDLFLQFYKSTFNIDDESYRRTCSFKGKHLLHLLYNCHLPSSPETAKGNAATLGFVHNATSLNYAGVSFKKSTSDHLLDLKFDDGFFYIPTLRVDGATDSLFRNFVAIEQCQRDTPHYITSYCMLLNRLVDTAEDVEVLVNQQIIENHLGDGSEVSGVFNDMCKEVVLKDFYFGELCDQVNAYSEDPWHSYKAALRLNYFKTPWTIISFIAAIILLVLTFLQTIYSVLSYYQSPHSPTAIIAVFASLGGILVLALLSFVLYYCLIKKKNKKKLKTKTKKKKKCKLIRRGHCVEP